MLVEIDAVFDVECELGEGPVWLPESSELVWVDIVAGRIHRVRPGTDQTSVIQLPHMVGAVASAAGGKLVAATEDGFSEIGTAGVERTLNRLLGDQPDIRMNDGKCDPAGRFVAGTTSLSGAPGSGALCRLEDDGSVTKILDGLSVSNGLAWSADGMKLFHIDTPRQAITVWNYHPDNALDGEPAVLVDTKGLSGVPDGMTIDREGNLWVAFWNGHAVRCFSPTGDLLDEISLPVSRPTSCTFGGEDLRTLYITTARFGLEPEELDREAWAGRILSCRPGATGLAPTAWRGIADAAAEDEVDTESRGVTSRRPSQ